MLGNPIDVKSIRKKSNPQKNKRKRIKNHICGKINLSKGLDRILNVFSKLNNVEFIIIGEGEQKNI